MSRYREQAFDMARSPVHDLAPRVRKPVLRAAGRSLHGFEQFTVKKIPILFPRGICLHQREEIDVEPIASEPQHLFVGDEDGRGIRADCLGDARQKLTQAVGALLRVMGRPEKSPDRFPVDRQSGRHRNDGK